MLGLVEDLCTLVWHMFSHAISYGVCVELCNALVHYVLFAVRELVSLPLQYKNKYYDHK